MITIPIPNIERRNINHDAQQLARFIGIQILQKGKDIEIVFDPNKLDYEYTADPLELKVWIPKSKRYFLVKEDRIHPFIYCKSELFTE